MDTPPSAALMALPQTSLQVSVFVDPSNVEKFLAEFKKVFEKVVAEPELLYFEVFQDPDEPGHLSWIENWNASVEWLLTNQLSKEYYKEYFAITEPMFVKPREFKILKRFGGPLLAQKEQNAAKV